LVGPTDWKIILQRQNAYADAVAGIPVPLPGLSRMAEPVWLTRLQTFLPDSTSTLCQGITGNDALSHHVLAHEASAFNTQNLTP